MLKYAEACYSRSFELCGIEPNKDILSKRIFDFHTQHTTLCTEELSLVVLPSKVRKLLQECQYYFSNGVEKLKKLNKPILLSSMYLDIAYKFYKFFEYSEEYNFRNMVCV